MGQYYAPLLINDEGYMFTAYSYDFDNGLKLMEHSWIGNNFVNTILKMLDNTPMRIAWLGDNSYDLCDDAYTGMGGGFVPDKQGFINYYKRVWDKSCTPQTLLMKDKCGEYPLDIERADCFLVNTTKNSYLDLREYINENVTFDGSGIPWCVHPLPLLTAVGNGLGRGDFFGDIGREDVGSWAFDRIYITVERPEKLEKFTCHFKFF